MNWLDWYHTLAKPGWTPAPKTIGLIWNILYPIIAVSFGYVFVQALRRRIPARTALPFAINLAANLSFTPLFFGLRNISLATADIVLVWGTILWGAGAIWPYARWVSMAQVPYFVWVSIALSLQLCIWAWN
jgi:tryptophan-rich sensory protein